MALYHFYFPWIICCHMETQVVTLNFTFKQKHIILTIIDVHYLNVFSYNLINCLDSFLCDILIFTVAH